MEGLARWRSHKTVQAGKIKSIEHHSMDANFLLEGEVGDFELTVDNKVFARGWPSIGDYIVVYEDGYISWSPARPFEDGYTIMDGDNR